MIAPLRDLLAPTLAASGLEATCDLWRVGEIWREAVGPAIERQASPVGLARGELVIAVPDAVWRQELVMLAPEIKIKINRALGREAIARLRFVGGSFATSPPLAEARVASRGTGLSPTAAGPTTSQVETQGDPPTSPSGLGEAIAALGRARASRLARERGGRRGGC